MRGGEFSLRRVSRNPLAGTTDMCKNLIIFLLMYVSQGESVAKETIRLPFGIELRATLVEDFGDEQIFSSLKILRNGKTIYQNDTDTRFVLDKKKYPKVLKLDSALFVVLVEIWDTPDINKLLAVYVNNSSVIRTDILPFFSQEYGAKPTILSGVMNIIEVPCLDCDSSFYQPVLYYRVSSKGIILDSSLTIRKNTEYYGTFLGFQNKYQAIKVKQRAR